MDQETDIYAISVTIATQLQLPIQRTTSPWLFSLG
jgi:hypothetical protein